MRIQATNNIRLNSQPRPPIFKANKDLFKRSEELKPDFIKILQELINPKDC